MQFLDHRLTNDCYAEAKAIGDEIVPEIVVMHDTGSSLDPGSARDFLLENSAKVSAHFVVERHGEISQLVPTNRRANHAGQSTYHGKRHCNNFSIGIEIVNPGRMTRGITGARSWFGRSYDLDVYDIREISTPEHGSGLWMPYTEDQLNSVAHLLRSLFEYVPSLNDIVTHWYISPGRKIDTNPLFPIEQLRARILGRTDPVSDRAEERSQEAKAGSKVQIVTPDDSLNMRRWPSFNPNVIGSVPHGTIVPVLRGGHFGGRAWGLILYGGKEGWIVTDYTQPVNTEEFQHE